MSFEICDETSSVLALNGAILLYGMAGASSVDFATVHPVSRESRDAAPAILEGRPLDRNQFGAICASLCSATQACAGVFPDTVLNVGFSHVIWWQRPGERTYFFDCAPAAEGIRSPGKRAGAAPAPGIVFVARERHMWVFAVKGAARPTEETPLFHMPAMNVGADGAVCTGSVPLPSSTVVQSVAAWESVFWNSRFTHPNHTHPVRYGGGIHAFSADLLDGKFKKFPQRVLCAIPGLTLGSLVERFSRGQGA